MKRLFLSAIVMASLSGCATYSPSMPPEYTGPKATLKDTVKEHGSSKADFFYVSHVDGRELENSRIKTLRLNRGRGMMMTPSVLENPIPAKPTILTIVGRTEYAAPILALTNAVYQVKGSTEFTPEANKTYVVRGELGESYSAVWLEEEGTRRVIGKKTEINGSAALGTFEK